MNLIKNISKGVVVLCSLVIVSCSSDDENTITNVNPVVSANGKMTVRASMSDDNVTRTSYNNNNVSWDESDAIWIYNSNKYDNAVQYGKFTIEELKSEKEAIFTGNAISYKEKATDGENQMYALYPAPSNGNASTIVTSNGTTTLSTELPAVQTAVDNTFDPKAHIMTAHSTNTTFYFNNLVTLVKVTVGDTGPFNVHAVRLTANKPLAGQFTATINADGTTQNVTVSAGSNSVVIEKNDNGTFTKLMGDYYIAVLPGSLSEGFTIQFEDLTSGNEKIYRRKVKAGTNNAASQVIKIGTYSTATDGYKIGTENTGLPISATAGATVLYTNGVIDLGLPDGTLWTTRNIAAGENNLFVNNVYDYGQYYGWGEDFGYGETTTKGTNVADNYCNRSGFFLTGYSFSSGKKKTLYEWNTYKYSRFGFNAVGIEGFPSMGKYSNAASNILEPYENENKKGDDIAQIKSKGLYSMPTQSQASVLVTNCTGSSTLTNYSSDNQAKGFRLVSKIAGYTTRSLWLPAAGIYYGAILNGGTDNAHYKHGGEQAQYWTKELQYTRNFIPQIGATGGSITAGSAYCLDLPATAVSDDRRYAGRTIRPVLNK